jgi:two-component system, LytTR family, sensor kinase
MSKQRITYIHIFIWFFALFANLPYSGILHGMLPRQIVSNVIAFLYLMVAFYLFYLYIAPIFLNKKDLTGFFSVSFLVVLLMPFFGYMILFVVRSFFDGTFGNFFRGYSVKMHMSGFYPVLTAAVFGSFFRIIISWFAEMNQKAELDKQMLAVELNLLKSKLNPHFLFNTLNNIDALIQSDPEKASSALIRLSEIMRYLTYETISDVVKLEKEIEYIRNFIGLFRLRIKSPDDIRFQPEGDMNVLISPALFVPLIENAFKYVSFGNIKPGIDIHISSMEGIVVFKISNFYDKNRENTVRENSGYGLDNLKKRLELAYPGKHRLKIERGEKLFQAELIIGTNGDKLCRH